MHVDMRTGEILNASLCLFDGFFYAQKMGYMLSMAGADPNARKSRYSQSEINDLLRATLMQYAGINLGLETNLKASSVYPVDSLRSPSFTRKYGLSPSVMDNLPYNYVAQPEDVKKGVRVVQRGLGEYDFHVIKWLYQPIPEAASFEDETDVLDRWSRERHHNPNLKFGHVTAQFYDPSSCPQDLGDDPLKAMRYYVANVKRLSRGFLEWFKEDDVNYIHRTLIYKNMANVCLQRMVSLAFNLGGLYQENVYSTEGIPLFTPVPREKQKEIVRFLLDTGKDMSWIVNKDAERELEISNSAEYEMSNQILAMIFGRLSAIAFAAEKGSGYTVEECMDDIYRDVWEGTLKKRKLTSLEMRRQKQFLSIVSEASTVEKVSVKGAGLRAFAGEIPGISSSANNNVALMNDLALQAFAHRDTPATLYSGTGATDLRVLPRGIQATEFMPAEHYFGMLIRVQDLLKGAVGNSSGDTKLHYEYLLYKIKKSLNSKK